MSELRVYAFPEETDEIDDQSMGNSPSNDEKDHSQESYENDKDTPPSQHTPYLDLTYAEGVDMRDTGSYYDEDDDDDGDMAPMSTGSVSKNSKSSATKHPSETPGKVVDSGQEHTGRWTREEHEAFLSALRVYGKEWKKVAAKVKTRTVVQTRTHAQKYFQKLQKAMEQSGGKGVTDMDVEMGVAADAKKISSHSKRKRMTIDDGAPPLPAKTVLPVSTKQARSASMIGAAQLISTLSSAGVTQMQAPPPQPAPSFDGGGSSHYSTAAASVPLNNYSSNVSLPQTQHMPLQVPHGFTTTTTATTSDSMQRPFSSAASGWNTSSLMKIVAPDHDSAMKQGKFPEPSPAACGKRKLAEIAAARMLAGVAAGGSNHMPSMYSQNDGDATPPPEPEMDGSTTITNSGSSSAVREIPSLPLETQIPAAPRKGLSLQIVNPEALGIVADDRRRRHGEMSPQTPWDSQLEVLVR